MEEDEWTILRQALESAGLSFVPIFGRPIRVHADLSDGFCDMTGRNAQGNLEVCDYDFEHTGEHSWENEGGALTDPSERGRLGE